MNVCMRKTIGKSSPHHTLSDFVVTLWGWYIPNLQTRKLGRRQINDPGQVYTVIDRASTWRPQHLIHLYQSPGLQTSCSDQIISCSLKLWAEYLRGYPHVRPLSCSNLVWRPQRWWFLEPGRSYRHIVSHLFSFPLKFQLSILASAFMGRQTTCPREKRVQV